MLFRSGENLLKGAISFIDLNSEITLFSAYLKLDSLKKLNKSGNIKEIVVRWDIKDLCIGVSDFEKLYDYCRENNILLYRNTRLHAKVFWNNFNKVFLGSANVTGRGLASVGDKFNFELNAQFFDISTNDILYLKKILKQSKLVSESHFKELLEKVEIGNKLTESKYPVLETVPEKEDSFLLSQLPMSISPEKVWNIYLDTNKKNILKSEKKCGLHDIVNYNLEGQLSEENFYLLLKNNFNNHLFIKKLKEAIKLKSNNYMGFSEINNWISKNTTTVPTPRRWDLRDAKTVQILHNWICSFDKMFVSEIRHPNGSDRLIYNNTRNEALIKFINGLNRDRARGDLAPHQIILLASLLIEFTDSHDKKIQIDSLITSFENIWINNAIKFKSINMNIGMPIKSFENQGYINLRKKNPIKDYRNLNDLKNNIDYLELNFVLTELFETKCTEKDILNNI